MSSDLSSQSAPNWRVPLSPGDWAVLYDADFYDRKSRLDTWLQALLNETAERLQSLAAGWPHPLPASSTPRLTRGESYQGRPYRVVDCPRLYREPDIWTYRVVVRWGKGWGCHWLLQGAPLQELLYRVPWSEWPDKLPGWRLRAPEDFWEWAPASPEPGPQPGQAPQPQATGQRLPQPQLAAPPDAQHWACWEPLATLPESPERAAGRFAQLLEAFYPKAVNSNA